MSTLPSKTQKIYKVLTEEELEYRFRCLLEDDWSIPKIAEKYNVSSAAIHKWLKKFNLSRRVNLRSKDFLYDQYLNQQKSLEDISKLLNVTPTAVSQYMRKFNIPIRDPSERQKLASGKRLGGANFPLQDLRSLGYCIRCEDLWFGSAAEFCFFLMLKKRGVKFVHQPFTYNKHRPDFLVNDKVVVEVKCGYARGSGCLEEYLEWSKDMKSVLGYEFHLIDFSKRYKKKYKEVLQRLKGKGAVRGKTLLVTIEEFL